MKIINDGKLFGKISVIDMLVVIILIFVVAGVIAKYTQVNNNNQLNMSSIAFEYDVKFEYVRPTTGTMLQVGDKVYDKVAGTEIGEITKVVVNNAEQQFNGLNGTIEKKEVNNKADITITVNTSGSMKNREYMANDLIRILVGKTLQIKTKYVDITGTILDIRNLEK